jgi:hypothetical protein
MKTENDKSTEPTVPVEQRRTSLGSLTPEQIRHYDEDGYLVRSRKFPERVARLEDWLAHRLAACGTSHDLSW